MKSETLVKLALNDDVSFQVKAATAKYIDKSFPGDTSKIKSVSKTMRELTKVKEIRQTKKEAQDED